MKTNKVTFLRNCRVTDSHLQLNKTVIKATARWRIHQIQAKGAIVGNSFQQRVVFQGMGCSGLEEGNFLLQSQWIYRLCLKNIQSDLHWGIQSDGLVLNLQRGFNRQPARQVQNGQDIFSPQCATSNGAQMDNVPVLPGSCCCRLPWRCALQLVKRERWQQSRGLKQSTIHCRVLPVCSYKPIGFLFSIKIWVFISDTMFSFSENVKCHIVDIMSFLEDSKIFTFLSHTSEYLNNLIWIKPFCNH